MPKSLTPDVSNEAAQFVLVDRIQEVVRDREQDRLGPSAGLASRRSPRCNAWRSTWSSAAWPVASFQHGIRVVIHVAGDIDRLGAQGRVGEAAVGSVGSEVDCDRATFQADCRRVGRPQPPTGRSVVLSVACPARLITLAVPWLASPVRKVNPALRPSEKEEFAAVLLIVKGWPGNVPLTWIVPKAR